MESHEVLEHSAGWRKASASNGGAGCVEVKIVEGGVALRDSKYPQAGVLLFYRAEWEAFQSGVRAGEFDLT
ncbi:DUF397 domain-containing protein [Sinosporangium siamense]|uniref:DUF397 domain-containing protein n=1 Tax=Sinosporangium siamense TaxID=1367973 RepID=A0A919V7U1_9ACTN|nr:DUF397 domain-containing protein [Sinosporangium siamense]GII95475.1 hypothetical protein Ssi02_57060 [Sinosporangium siamense]